MTFKEMIESLFGFASPTYYRWKKEKRPIVELIEKCFTEQELEQFVQTNKIPYKIEWANRNFRSLYESFTRYLVYNEGAKALFSVLNIQDIDIKDIDSLIVKEYNNNNIDEYDMIQYFNSKPSYDLLLYIFENKNSNWALYKDTVRNSDFEWFGVYLDIVLIAIEKNIFDKCISNTNKNIDYGIVPPVPELFTYTRYSEAINKKYFNLLSSIYDAIKRDDYKNLGLYSFYGYFDLNTSPVDKDNLQSIYEFEAERLSQNIKQ